MFITIIDFLVFILFAGCIIAAYIYLRGISREKLTSKFILHNAYSMNPIGGLTYDGMAVVVDENGSRSPRAKDLPEEKIETIVRWNYQAAENLSWIWPVALPLTSYRIRKALELAQIRQDIEQNVYGEEQRSDESTRAETSPREQEYIAHYEVDVDEYEFEDDSTPPTVVMDRIAIDKDAMTEVFDTAMLQDNLPVMQSNGSRNGTIKMHKRDYVIIPRPEKVSSPEDDEKSSEHDAKIQDIAENILTTLQTTEEEVAEQLQESIEKRSQEVQEKIEIERNRGFLK